MDRKIVEFLISGKGVNKIAQELHVCKRRIRRLREQAQSLGYLGSGVALPAYPSAIFPEDAKVALVSHSGVDELLSAHRDWIVNRLEVGWRPVTVFEELPVQVNRSSFYRFLERHQIGRLGSQQRRVVPEIVHQPGEALLVDWGKLRDVLDPQTGKKRTLWAFVGVLGFSRYMMVRLVWSNDVPTTLNVLGSMFEELGGIPTRITSDNPKCFVLEASRYEPILNPAYERFAAHYGTRIECLPPRDPQKKGKVERPMPYVRRLYEAHGSSWNGIEESQSYMDKKVSIANERKHGTTARRPIDDLLVTEVLTLKPLPPLAYEIEEFHEGTVRGDGHVRFRGKYYSVDEKFIKKEVVVLGSSKQVSIYHRGHLIEVHDRLTDDYRSKSTKSHHLKPWEQAMQEDSHYRTRAASLGPFVDRMVAILIAQGQGFIDTRKVWGILSLDKTYPAEQIDAACKHALELHSHSYQTVKNLLKLGVGQIKREATPVEEAQSDLASNQSGENENKNKKNKFVRDLSEYKKQLSLFH
jgi:transposase